MNGKEVFRTLQRASHWSQNKIAHEIGMTSQDLSQRMNVNVDLRADVLAELLSVIGYELIAVPKGTRLPNKSMRIEPSGPVDKKKK